MRKVRARSIKLSQHEDDAIVLIISSPPIFTTKRSFYHFFLICFGCILLALVWVWLYQTALKLSDTYSGSTSESVHTEVYGMSLNTPQEWSIDEHYYIYIVIVHCVIGHALSVVMHCLLHKCRSELWFLGKPNCVQLLQTWVTPTLNPTEINNNWNKHCYKHIDCIFNSLTFLEKKLKEYFVECSKQLKLYQQIHADNV